MIKARESIYAITPYVGGESARARDVVKLSSNEGPFGPPPAAVTAIQKIAEKGHLYPDGSCTDLRHALAEKNNINAGNIVCGAGSDEIISLLCQAYLNEGDEVVHSAHGFLMYAISTKVAGGVPVAVPEKSLKADVDGLLAAVTAKTRLLFLANPNNPTGSYLNKAELKKLHDGLPQNVLLVLDAAYTEYVDEPDYTDGHEWVESAENIVVTRTFSKIYGLSGLRLGWCHAPSHVVDILHRVRGPFNVSSVAQAAGLAALQDEAFIEKSKKHNREYMIATQKGLEALGYTVYPSLANFVLVECETAERANHILENLKAKHIYIRQMAGYGLPSCLRISIGTGGQMEKCIMAMKESHENV